MQRIKLSTLPVGKTLARNLYGHDGQLLLGAGLILNLSHVEQLQHMGYQNVYIFDPEDSMKNWLEENADMPAKKTKRQEFAEVFSETVESVRNMMSNVSAGHHVKSSEVEETINLLYPQVMDTNNVLKYLKNLRQKDEYTLQHSVSVAVVSIKIGQAMKISARELKNLGIAGLLHDIGKCKIALDIINKPGPLDDLECEEIKKHPLYGYKIVKESQLAAPGVERAVLQHHEHQDGSGYPLKMKGKAIHTYSNIVAVADVFDALTSDRVYRSRMPLLHAIDLILKKTFGHLDPLISRSLSQYVLNISPGERVLLNSGERATVIKINENNPTRPLVKMGEAFIDLENERHIYIEDMLD